MVNLILGPEGSGKTKQLIASIDTALKNESGNMVCIEKGNTMRFDVDHRVRLIDSGEYSLSGYPFLKGFVSGLHAGNFDIVHVFIDNLYKVSQTKSADEAGEFLAWCDAFSEKNGVSFTLTLTGEPDKMPASLTKYMK